MNRRYLLLALCCSFPITALTADATPVWTDAAKATQEDPDFSIQGEYAGKLGDAAVGLHLVAEGGGKFAAVLYPGGLPGAGFTGDRATRIKGTATSTKVTLPNQEGTIQAGKIVFPNGMLERTDRKSPTLGMKAPEGAIILFDGKSTEAFPGAKLDGDTLQQGLTSKQQWQNFSIHFEFKTPYQPKDRGQKRGNSGCYLQGRYETQILDSFGLEGQNNECGGIYTIRVPDQNMAFPPLSWQTYDIDFTAAKFDASGKKTANAFAKIKHNGVVIHEKVEFTHATTASPLKEGPEPGPIHLQDHGNPVRFRNIWLVEKP